MVEQQINIAPSNVNFNPTEATFVLSTAKADLQKIDVAQVRDAGLKNTETYDWLFSSSGADTPGSVDVHHRSLRITPQAEINLAIPSFFTAVAEDTTSKLNAFIRLNYNNDIDVDVFFSYAQAAGLVTYDAYFWTFDLPPGGLEIDPLPNINNFAHYEIIPLRQDNAQRRYLVVGLALP